MQGLIYVSTTPFVFFLQDSEHSFLICSSSPFCSAAPAPSDGALCEFIGVIVPGVWSAALGGQVPASGSLHSE